MWQFDFWQFKLQITEETFDFINRRFNCIFCSIDLFFDTVFDFRKLLGNALFHRRKLFIHTFLYGLCFIGDGCFDFAPSLRSIFFDFTPSLRSVRFDLVPFLFYFCAKLCSLLFDRIPVFIQQHTDCDYSSDRSNSDSDRTGQCSNCTAQGRR